MKKFQFSLQFLSMLAVVFSLVIALVAVKMDCKRQLKKVEAIVAEKERRIQELDRLAEEVELLSEVKSEYGTEQVEFWAQLKKVLAIGFEIDGTTTLSPNDLY